MVEYIYDISKLKTIDLELRDYIHYYVGCRYRLDWPDGQYVEDILEAILFDGMICGTNIARNKVGNDADDSFEAILFDKKDPFEGTFRFILTHSNDMTEQQRIEYRSYCYPVEDFNDKQKVLRWSDTPLSMHYIFKHGIDAFDLIEKGLAIDKKYHK